MKAFVTGGSGFLGGALIRALKGRGDHVGALARSEAAAQRVRQVGADELTRRDLSQPEALRRGMEDSDCVFRAVALAVKRGNPEDFTRQRHRSLGLTRAAWRHRWTPFGLEILGRRRR